MMRKIERSDWALPIVVVSKADGKLHLCEEYKVQAINAAKGHKLRKVFKNDCGCV